VKTPLMSGETPCGRETEDEQDQKNRDEKEKQEFRDGDRGSGDGREAQHPGDQAENQKHKRPAEHRALQLSSQLRT